MSKSDVWMPLYVRDYLTATGHLTTEQDGAYLRLLMHSWVTGALPDDDEKLARLCKLTVAKWQRSVKADVMTFFDLGPNGWTQKRLEKERRGAKKKTEQKSTAANARWLKHNETTDAAASPVHQSRISPSPSPSERKKEPPIEPPLLPSDAPAAPTPKSKASRGSRIPPDFQPNETGIAYAQARGVIRSEVGKFVNYWTAEAGSKATKLDWQAAWRTWCDKQVEFGRAHPPRDAADPQPRVFNMTGYV